MVNPFAYDEYRKDKIRQKIEESRAQRVQLKVWPSVSLNSPTQPPYWEIYHFSFHALYSFSLYILCLRRAWQVWLAAVNLIMNQLGADFEVIN